MEKLIDCFGESAFDSIRFLENLSKKDAQWSVIRDAIVDARKARQKCTNGSSEDLLYAPKDVENAA